MMPSRLDLHLTGTQKNDRKSSPNTFFSARVAQGNSDILFVYLFFVAEFPDRLKNRRLYFGIF